MADAVTVSYSGAARACPQPDGAVREPRGPGTTTAMTTHQIRAVMAANGGLLTWAQARDGGLSTPELRHLVRRGILVPLRRGVYVDGELWRSLDPYREQHRLRTRAVIANLKRGFVVSHDSSAYELELDILAPPVPHTHITRPGSTTAWTRYGVKHHYARYGASQIVVVDGLEVLDPARTAVDIAREHGEPYGEIACDAALRLGVSKTAAPGRLRADDQLAAHPAHSPSRRLRAPRGTNRDRDPRPAAGRGARRRRARPAVPGPGRGRQGLLGRHPRRAATSSRPTARSSTSRPRRAASRRSHRARSHGKPRSATGSSTAQGLGTSHVYWEDCWPPKRAGRSSGSGRSTTTPSGASATGCPERLARQAREIRGDARGLNGAAATCN